MKYLPSNLKKSQPQVCLEQISHLRAVISATYSRRKLAFVFLHRTLFSHVSFYRAVGKFAFEDGDLSSHLERLALGLHSRELCDRT